MFRAVFISDIHLMKLQKFFKKDHIDIQISEVEKAYTYAIDNDIKHVIIPGDIADTPFLPYDAYISLILLLKKYDGVIHTWYIPGNHDFSDIKRTSMDLLKVLESKGMFKTFHLMMGAEQLEIDGVMVNLLPYPCNEALPNKRPCLNVTHVNEDGAIGDNGRKVRVKNSFSRPKKDFVVSGHYHKYQHLEKRRFIYVGAPYQTNFGETGVKGFVDLKAKEVKGKLKVVHKQINSKPCFRLKELEIKEPEDFGQLENSERLFYKLYISSDILIPKDLRISFPNIIYVYDLAKKSRQITVEDEVIVSDNQVESSSLELDPKKGLAKFLKDKGFKKQQALLARDEVDSALKVLGY